MKISKLRRYVTWNVISAIGFFATIITIVFLVLISVASSGLNVRPDVDKYFFHYIIQHIINPFIEFYKFQLLIIAVLMVGSRLEHKHYVKNSEFGLNLFENNEKVYSIIFTTGVVLNFLPLYVLFIGLMSFLLRLF